MDKSEVPHSSLKGHIDHIVLYQVSMCEGPMATTHKGWSEVQQLCVSRLETSEGCVAPFHPHDR